MPCIQFLNNNSRPTLWSNHSKHKTFNQCWLNVGIYESIVIELFFRLTIHKIGSTYVPRFDIEKHNFIVNDCLTMLEYFFVKVYLHISYANVYTFFFYQYLRFQISGNDLGENNNLIFNSLFIAAVNINSTLPYIFTVLLLPSSTNVIFAGPSVYKSTRQIDWTGLIEFHVWPK